MTGRAVRGRWTAAADFGQPWSRWGEWRLGAVVEAVRVDPEIVAGPGGDVAALQPVYSQERSLRGVLVVDQLDHASFPRRGWRVKLVGQIGRRGVRSDGMATRASEPFHRLELDANLVSSHQRHTLDASLRLRQAYQQALFGASPYTLGGFHNLSGYKADQLAGNQVLLGRLSYTLRLNQQPVLTRGFFAGATLEAGNAWADPGGVRAGDLRWGGSAFLGADTGLGPLYFGLTWAPLGSAGLYLLLGRP
jgi:NTE family protein